MCQGEYEAQFPDLLADFGLRKRCLPPNTRGTTASAIKKAANHDFFIAMRNRSIDPPMKGKKEYPNGGATAMKGLCFVNTPIVNTNV
eukprot:jgi/Tetstr1/465519/TSEL_010188.t1